MDPYHLPGTQAAPSDVPVLSSSNCTPAFIIFPAHVKLSTVYAVPSCHSSFSSARNPASRVCMRLPFLFVSRTPWSKCPRSQRRQFPTPAHAQLPVTMFPASPSTSPLQPYQRHAASTSAILNPTVYAIPTTATVRSSISAITYLPVWTNNNHLPERLSVACAKYCPGDAT